MSNENKGVIECIMCYGGEEGCILCEGTGIVNRDKWIWYFEFKKEVLVQKLKYIEGTKREGRYNG